MRMKRGRKTNLMTIKRLQNKLKDANRKLNKEIADAKQAQAALAKAHDELEEKVAARTAELILAKEAAENANRAKDTFLVDMSHEIRTPVSGIIGCTYLVMKSDLSEKQREQMNHIKLSCDHLLSVINDILDLSKIEAGRLQLTKTKFHLPTLVETVIATLTPKSQEKKLALSYHIEPNVPQDFIGDPTRLRQVLFNLVYNAIKFTGTGEVRLCCRVMEHTPRKTTLQFSVMDTGIGLTTEQLDRIFKRFAQADEQTRASDGGTGLGLFISKHLVKLMGGDIWVESAPGSGSSFNFTVRLPVHHGKMHTVHDSDQSGSLCQRAATAPPMIEDKENSDPKRCGLEILLVEDDLINRKMEANMLEKMGACVTTAENGTEALKTMEKRRFDIILMDVKMPVMDGIETTRRIREGQVKGANHIPIIAMTAHAMPGDSERFLRAGMNDYISKPIDPDTLLAKLWIWHHKIPKSGKDLQMANRLVVHR